MKIIIRPSRIIKTIIKILLIYLILILSLIIHLSVKKSYAKDPVDEFPVSELVNYITMLRASYTQGSITIEFEPLKDDNIRYRIYRSVEAIKSEGELAKAMIVAEISASELPFRDIPNKDGRYYYTVTPIREEVEDARIIPYHTTTPLPVDFSPIQGPIEELRITPSRESEPGKWIVNINFRPASEKNTYHLYIRTEKLEGIVEGSPSLSVSGRTGQFSTIINEGKPYYFIVTAVNRLGVENPVIIPGRNENETAFVLEPTVKKAQTVEKPATLERRPTGGELIDRNLRRNFYHGNYSRALDEFKTLIKRADLMEDQIALINFYIGQCLFYMNKPREALRHFILSKDLPSNTDIADAWIDRCLDNIDKINE